MASTKGTYQEKYPEKLLSALTYLHREYAAPIDDTTVWNTLEDLQAYLSMPNSYAYPGQIVAVANGTVDVANGDKEFSLYVIRSDLSLQPITSTKNYGSAAEVEANLDKLEIGTILSVWNEELERHELFTVEHATDGGKELQRQSFNAEDIPDVSWKNLKDKPESTVADIDAAVQFVKDFSNTSEPETPVEVGTTEITFGGHNWLVVNKTDTITTLMVTDFKDKMEFDAPEPSNPDTNRSKQGNNCWRDSNVRQWLNSDKAAGEWFTPTTEYDVAPSYANIAGFLNGFTAEEKAKIIPKDNVTLLSQADGEGSETTTDMVWIPSATELIGTTYNNISEGNQLEYFKDIEHRKGDSTCWTRSPNVGYSHRAWGMNTGGTSVNLDVNYARRMCQCIQISTADVQELLNPGSDSSHLIYNGKQVAFVEDIPTEYDAAKVTGVLSLENIPHGALERCVVVANEDAKNALTLDDAQPGDTVKNNATGQMYFVTGVADDGSLIYEPYTAAAATSVPWSGVTNKPTTLSGFGITDAVSSTDVTTVATANKILKLNADAKLPTDITGDADTVDGKHADDFADAVATANSLDALDTRVGTTETKIGTLMTDVSTVKTQTETNTTKLETFEKTVIPGLTNGSSITSIAAEKLDGTVSRDNLPIDISGMGIEVADAAARKALSAATVHNGWIVKETTTGTLYLVVDDTKLSEDIGYMVLVENSGLTVKWTNIEDTPTTLSEYGITDAVSSTDVTTVATANKILKLNAAAKLPADITGSAAKLGDQLPEYYAKAAEVSGLEDRVDGHDTDIADLQNGTTIKELAASKIKGVLSIDNLPHGALERCVVVADDEARMALTVNDVQAGDTVKVNTTGHMYFVIDDTMLNSEAGYEPYTAAAASSVPWSGVTNKPTTLSGFGITDAVSLDKLVSVASAANAGKLLRLNAEGKLDVDITGSVDWSKIANKPTSTVAAIDAAVAAATHANRTTLDGIGAGTYDAVAHLTYGSKTLANIDDVTKLAKSSARDAIIYSTTAPANAVEGQYWLQPITGVS